MKKILLTLLITLVFTSCFLKPKEFPLSGTIVDLYRTEADYKVSSGQYCVFYSDSLKRNICLYVTRNTYVNLKVGEHTSFMVSEYDLIQ